ncbi:thioredoxin family protein, partial [Salmonella sp. s58078]|uniref:thioredoxin family protein n=1 Tax=Salmonella sp. s58078 TaxID=3159699 RepID=UPI0039802260
AAAADVASWGRFPGGEMRRIDAGRRIIPGRIRSSLQENATVTVGQVTEVSKDTFWPLVEAAADKTVVLDMYTQWCGPCKVIAPKFQQLSEKYADVIFLKLDCNQDNKPLAKELGIRVVPTFKILKDGK